MTPKAPKATDSGLSASSTWATTREVALKRKAGPRPAGVDKPASTRATSRLPCSSCSPYRVGAPGASVTWPPGETATRPDQRRAEDHETRGAVDVVLHYLAVEHDDANQLEADADAGGTRAVPKAGDESCAAE